MLVADLIFLKVVSYTTHLKIFLPTWKDHVGTYLYYTSKLNQMKMKCTYLVFVIIGIGNSCHQSQFHFSSRASKPYPLPILPPYYEVYYVHPLNAPASLLHTDILCTFYICSIAVSEIWSVANFLPFILEEVHFSVAICTNGSNWLWEVVRYPFWLPCSSTKIISSGSG